MLKITSDGRKIGLDARMMDPTAPDEAGSKINLCVENVLRIWKETTPDRLTQIIFSDFSTPNLHRFNAYHDIREKLIAQGVPEKEIAFIHDYNTDAAKADLFAKVRNGDVRILLGSTQKLGVGTNEPAADRPKRLSDWLREARAAIAARQPMSQTNTVRRMAVEH